MCGFIGIYGPDGTDVAGELYEGLLAIQHRGQDAAGITKGGTSQGIRALASALPKLLSL